jgi:hypothetical protein
MGSPGLRKGFTPEREPARALTVHRLIGHLNPRCARCCRTRMQILVDPYARCERPNLLPFDGVDGNA